MVNRLVRGVLGTLFEGEGRDTVGSSESGDSVLLFTLTVIWLPNDSCLGISPVTAAIGEDKTAFSSSSGTATFRFRFFFGEPF